jgi:hypothetical protein
MRTFTAIASVNLVTAFLVGLAVASAQEPAGRWSGSAQLSKWLGGADPRAVQVQDDVLLINVSDLGRPNTIFSPWLSIPPEGVRGIRITYFAQLEGRRPARLLVGWRDSATTDAEAQKCILAVPIVLGRWDTVEADFTGVPCWSVKNRLVKIGTNAEGGYDDVTGTLRIRSIESLPR